MQFYYELKINLIKENAIKNHALIDTSVILTLQGIDINPHHTIGSNHTRVEISHSF